MTVPLHRLQMGTFFAAYCTSSHTSIIRRYLSPRNGIGNGQQLAPFRTTLLVVPEALDSQWDFAGNELFRMKYCNYSAPDLDRVC